MKYIKTNRGVSWAALIAIAVAVYTTSAAVPAAASPSCDSVFPIAMIQSTFPGKAASLLPNQPARGALLVNCAYRVSGSGTISLKLFDSSLESPYGTTVNQMRGEGYKCVAIDGTVGFPASSCGLVAGAVTINSIVFTSTNGKFAAILTGVSSPTSLSTMAKTVNSNIASH